MFELIGCDVYVLQSTCTPLNDHLVELLLIIDALKRASAKRIVAMMPYYGYARQDRKTQPRVPISAALVAELLEASGANRVICVDFHCGQIQGFFRNIPVDNLYARPALIDYCINHLNLSGSICCVSPDHGGVERAAAFKNGLTKKGFNDITMAMMNKKRVEANQVETMELVGNVKDYDCILVDDICDTATTLCTAAAILKQNGAKRVFACCTHPLLNRDALQKLTESPIEKLIVTNSVPLNEEKKKHSKIVQVSLASIVAAAIRNTHNEESISHLFE